MKDQGSLLILLLLGGVIAYAVINKPKRKGTIIVDPLGPGEFIDDPADLLSDYEKALAEI
jgi:hypothetical protein|tara:strand:- start:6265 stop:6444 length:180 start_codon:yes stop_codon:yes gene_type:complete